MPKLVLMFDRWDDREGTVPLAVVNIPNADLDAVQFVLNDFLYRVFDTPENGGGLWFEPWVGFNLAAEEGYGRVYAGRVPTRVTGGNDAYAVACRLWTVFWEYVEQGEIAPDKYHWNGGSVDFDVRPVAVTEPPTDSRFTVGETLVPVGSDSVWFRGGYYEKNEVTYAGVYWDPFDRFSNIGRKWDNGAVWLGVEVDEQNYLKRAVVDEVLGRDIQIYPHPIHPKYRWFTRLAGTKLEGYGRTQREAKYDLAVKVALSER